MNSRMNLGIVTLLATGLAFTSISAVPRASGQTRRVDRDQRSVRPEREQPVPREQVRPVEELSAAFRRVVRAVSPSVVSIRSTQTFAAPGEQGPAVQPGGPFGRDFFERFFQFRAPGQNLRQQGFGSGVIVSPDGYVLTANHVVGNAQQVTVTLADERTFMAEVVGNDDKTDLAVLRIKGSDLTPAELGNSDELEVGDWVLAVGNPFGLSETVTAGIISAKGRANIGISEYEDFIQTDAAINPGNSGGPLVAMDGRVVGINSAIFSRTGGYMGIGFAIPMGMARGIMDSIIHSGRVVRGWLGVTIQDLTPELASSFKYEGRNGVLVGDVARGSPAERAGLREGDVIVEVNDRPIRSSSQLRNLIAGLPPGARATLRVFRGGNERSVDVQVGELQAQTSLAQNRPQLPSGEASSQLGIHVQNLTRETAEQLGLENARGVLVTAVEPDSLADDLGIRENDVIIAAGDRQIENVDEFRDAMRNADLRTGIRLQLRSDGTRRFVYLRRSGNLSDRP
ncbi:MAG TPA: DegQ family serine endoprotease [Phycisphaerae bacterium]|jgi:serine protease Do